MTPVVEPSIFWAILMDGSFVSSSGSPPINCRYWCREGDTRWTDGWITYMEEKIGPASRAKGKPEAKKRPKHVTESFLDA